MPTIVGSKSRWLVSIVVSVAARVVGMDDRQRDVRVQFVTQTDPYRAVRRASPPFRRGRPLR